MCWHSIISPLEYSQQKEAEIQPFRIIQTCVDITEKHITNKKTAATIQRFKAVVNNVYDGIITIDKQQNITLFNEAAELMFGYSEAEVINKPLTMLIPKKYQNKHSEYVEDFKASPVNCRPMQNRTTVHGLRKNGVQFPIEVSISKIMINNNTEFTAVIRDVSDKNELLEELILSSRKDALTELYNRRYFTELCNSEISRAKRYKRGFSLLMLDIDHFKVINDKFGHACGDAALIAFSQCLVRSLREVDITCRWGGEEFLVLLPETLQKTAVTVAEKIRINIENINMQYENNLIPMTVSIGVASFIGQALEMNQMINTVDKQLYHAKNTGRNKICVKG